MRNLGLGLIMSLLLAVAACQAPTGPEQPTPPGANDESGDSDESM